MGRQKQERLPLDPHGPGEAGKDISKGPGFQQQQRDALENRFLHRGKEPWECSDYPATLKQADAYTYLPG